MELELTAVVDSYGAMLLLIHKASFFFFFFFHFSPSYLLFGRHSVLLVAIK
jgi:hypothetical protein